MTCRVLVVGAGAIGGFYGSVLARAGAEVSVVCRSDYASVKQAGYEINSATLGRWRFMPQQVLQQVGDYDGAPDYLLLCTKVLPNLDRARLIAPAVSPHTTVVLIQNGVEIEGDLQRAFPNNPLVSGLAFICCNRLAPGVIHHLAYGKLTLGNYPTGILPQTTHLASLFSQSGIDCEVTASIQTARWQKCVWNAPFNPLSVLSGGLATQAILQHQEPLVRQIMAEVSAIAAAAGHGLPTDVIDSNIAKTRVMPPYKTSMLLDYERQQEMEIEAILGNAVRAGLRHSIACPYLQLLYGLMLLRAVEIGQSAHT